MPSWNAGYVNRELAYLGTTVSAGSEDTRHTLGVP